MNEQGKILEDEEFYVGGLAPSFMPETGYEYIAGVSGWPRPITPGLLGGGGPGGGGPGGPGTPGQVTPPEVESEVPPWEPPVYDVPEDPVPQPERRPTAGLSYSYSPYDHPAGLAGSQTLGFFSAGQPWGSLSDHVSGWEKPGWTSTNYYDLGVFNAQEYLHRTDPVGLYEEGAYSFLETPPYPYFMQQCRLEVAGEHPFGSEERKELMDAYWETENSYNERRGKEFNPLAQIGTRFASPEYDSETNYDNIYSRGEMTPYGIATSDSISTNPWNRAGGFINYDDTGSFFSDILDRTSKYYSPEADKVWNLGLWKDHTSDAIDPYDHSRQYFSIDPSGAGIETDNTAYWTTPTPEQIALLNPSAFSWTDTDPTEYVSSLPGGLLSDPIYGIVGGGIVDAGPVMDTPYG